MKKWLLGKSSGRRWVRSSAFVVLLVFAAAWALLGGSRRVVGEALPTECCLCHQEVCEEANTRRYVHAPVSQQNCVECHIVDESGGPLPLSFAEKTVLPPEHLPLTDQYFLNVKVCDKCHPDYRGTMSHPVEVFPTPGMQVPEGYSMLADGRMSCQTCHTAHASDTEYRLVRPTQKELCLGCHRNIN